MPRRQQQPQPQIVRIIRVRALPGQAAALERILPDDIKGRLRDAEGLIGWYALRPLDEDPDAYAIITIWRDKDALRGFVGASMRPPLIRDEPVSELTTEQFEVFGSS